MKDEEQEQWEQRSAQISSALSDMFGRAMAEDLVVGGRRYHVTVRHLVGGNRHDGEGVCAVVNVEGDVEDFHFSLALDGFGWRVDLGDDDPSEDDDA